MKVQLKIYFLTMMKPNDTTRRTGKANWISRTRMSRPSACRFIPVEIPTSDKRSLGKQVQQCLGKLLRRLRGLDPLQDIRWTPRQGHLRLPLTGRNPRVNVCQPRAPLAQKNYQSAANPGLQHSGRQKEPSKGGHCREIDELSASECTAKKFKQFLSKIICGSVPRGELDDKARRMKAAMNSQE